MVTDVQVRRLMTHTQQEKTLALAAAKAGMDEKTARKYVKAGRLPSELKVEHTWRTREDPFAEVWDWVRAQLAIIETEMVSIEEVFLPYLLMKDDKTLFETMENNKFYLKEG